MIDRTSLFKKITTFNYITINRNDYKARSAARRTVEKVESSSVMCVENTPIAGIQIDMFSLDRPTLIDPRGFKITLTYDKFVYLMSYVTVDKSQILDECVYVAEPYMKQIIPVPVDSDAHKLAIANSSVKIEKTHIKNVPVGSIVLYNDHKYEVIYKNVKTLHRWYFDRTSPYNYYGKRNLSEISSEKYLSKHTVNKSSMTTSKTILRNLDNSKLTFIGNTTAVQPLESTKPPTTYTKEDFIQKCFDNGFVPICFGKNEQYPVYHNNNEPGRTCITVSFGNIYNLYLEMKS